MTNLECINSCLAAISQSPISDINTQAFHSAEVTPFIDRSRKKILAEGYTFNTDTRTLPVTASGYVIVADNVLRIIFAPSQNNYCIRNGQVWNTSTSTVVTENINVKVVLDLDIEELPEVFGQYVAAESALQFLISKDQASSYPYYKKERDIARCNAANSEYVSLNNGLNYNKVIGGYNR